MSERRLISAHPKSVCCGSVMRSTRSLSGLPLERSESIVRDGELRGFKLGWFCESCGNNIILDPRDEVTVKAWRDGWKVQKFLERILS